MGGERRLFFSLQRARRKALQEGDLSPERVTKIAGLLGVTQGDAISMDCGLRGADYRLERGVWRRQ
jgi:RNA polymerase sigma-32 factor